MTPPRPHPFTRSRLAARLDWLVAMVWEMGWDEKPALEPEYLWKVGSKGFSEADEVSIRSDEDVADFRLRLDHLCRSLRDEARLNALGHTMAYGQITSAIRKRHALGRLWREKPELAETPIAPPLIVLGQMRSGTTRVQRLFAADPQFSGTRFCNSQYPVPESPDLRPFKAHAALAVAHRVNPWLETMHPIGATRTDEEIGWLAAALSPVAFEAQWRIPSFVRFSEAREASPIYREFARILRTDAATMGNAARPRVLKCPQFAEDMSALMAACPEARIVRCLRDKNSTLASSVSMVASQMAFQCRGLQFDELEEEWARKHRLREQRMQSFRSNSEATTSAIAFADLNSDPIAALQRAYSELGYDFTAQSRGAAGAELEIAREDRHVAHRQQVESFAT
ncbi:sulfotransferase [Erythrobacter sp. SD-21]|uniref:sulfotransferase n=1 Tax=Erythrobacter sp. SD-21 TaxID=161528 RepID=UPI000153F89B|nr:sulfotransferase [Erythrobacter sp. SD-21]EDL48581.1 Sulfotransferase [Erythrobacter sp. SD-21]